MRLKLELESVNVNSLDCDTICRFCLSDEGILLPIFGSKEDYHHELLAQIKTILSVEFEENDGLPSLICHCCLFNMERCFDFKKQCEQADLILRKHIENAANVQRNTSCQSEVENEIHEVYSKPLDNASITITESRANSNINSEETERYCDEETEDISELKIDSDEEKQQEKDNNNEMERNETENLTENSLLQMEERMNDLEEGMYGSEPFSLDLCSVRLQSESQGQETLLYPTSQLTDEDQWTDSGSDLSDELEGVEPMSVVTPAGNCPGCNKAFSSTSELERHQLIHKQEPPYPCDYCNQEFEEKTLLKAHWRAHARHKAHMCLTCGEAYIERADLVKHFAMHDVIKPYHCPSCGKAFAYRSDLRKHAIIHTGARPFKCPICNKTFTRSTNLNKHARVHTGRRPYPCDHCDKMFSSRGDLVRHAVIHTGEKPYACLICSLAFNRKDKLSRHERVHMTDRPFVCAECPTSFHRKEELTKHSRFHHFKPDPEFYNSSTE